MMHTNEQRNRRMGCSNAGIFTEALPVAEELGDRDRTCGWAVTECTGPRGTQTPQKESCQLVTRLPLNSSQQRSCDPGLGPVPTVEGRIGSLSCSRARTRPRKDPTKPQKADGYNIKLS